MLLTARNCSLYDSIEECKHVYFFKSIWEGGWGDYGAPQGGSALPHLSRKKLTLTEPVTQIYDKCITPAKGRGGENYYFTASSPPHRCHTLVINLCHRFG